MNAITPDLAANATEKPADMPSPRPLGPEVEAEIRDFVRRDVRQLRRPEAGELFANNVNALVQRIAGTSVRDIDNLLRELEGVREFLHSEGERVQREVANYALLSQAAMNSTRIISESMAQWRKQVETTRAG
jgi:hypothetical protein